MVKIPEITIGEKSYKAKPVTMKVWREITKADTVDEESTMAGLLGSRVHILALVYGIDDDVLDAMPVEEVLPAYKEAASYVSSLVFSRLEKMPKNAEAEADKK